MGSLFFSLVNKGLFFTNQITVLVPRGKLSIVNFCTTIKGLLCAREAIVMGTSSKSKSNTASKKSSAKPKAEKKTKQPSSSSTKKKPSPKEDKSANANPVVSNNRLGVMATLVSTGNENPLQRMINQELAKKFGSVPTWDKISAKMSPLNINDLEYTSIYIPPNQKMVGAAGGRTTISLATRTLSSKPGEEISFDVATGNVIVPDSLKLYTGPLAYDESENGSLGLTFDMRSAKWHFKAVKGRLLDPETRRVLVENIGTRGVCVRSGKLVDMFDEKRIIFDPSAEKKKKTTTSK